LRAEPPSISFKNVSFGFEKESVLQNLSFEAPDGQHTVLQGDSGSGKSTILNLLLGFFKPAAGQILYNQSTLSVHKIREVTAWLPQDLQIGEGSVRKVIEKPFQFSVNKSQTLDRKRLHTTLQTLGLVPQILEKQYRDLSTGQRQRVAIALCTLLDKQLVLLDEPTSALDKTSKEQVFNTLIAHTNKTIISTSHDPFWVTRADKVIQLD